MACHDVMMHMCPGTQMSVQDHISSYGGCKQPIGQDCLTGCGGCMLIPAASIVGWVGHTHTHPLFVPMVQATLFPKHAMPLSITFSFISFMVTFISPASFSCLPAFSFLCHHSYLLECLALFPHLSPNAQFVASLHHHNHSTVLEMKAFQSNHPIKMKGGSVCDHCVNHIFKEI